MVSKNNESHGTAFAVSIEKSLSNGKIEPLPMVDGNASMFGFSEAAHLRGVHTPDI